MSARRAARVRSTSSDAARGRGPTSEPDARDVPTIASLQRSYEDGRGLQGFRSACGFATATWGLRCPRCGAADLTPVDLPSVGRVVGASVQHVPSDEFLNEAPYAYVIVELEGGARVTGWIPSGTGVEIGARVRWVPSYKPGVQFALEATPSGALPP